MFKSFLVVVAVVGAILAYQLGMFYYAAGVTVPLCSADNPRACSSGVVLRQTPQGVGCLVTVATAKHVLFKDVDTSLVPNYVVLGHFTPKPATEKDDPLEALSEHLAWLAQQETSRQVHPTADVGIVTAYQNAKCSRLVALRLKRPEVILGEPIRMSGYPLFAYHQSTAPVLSYEDNFLGQDHFWTANAFFYGNSGGPAFDLMGNLVGIGVRFSHHFPHRTMVLKVKYLEELLDSSEQE
jgi:hypothetical protein